MISAWWPGPLLAVFVTCFALGTLGMLVGARRAIGQIAMAASIALAIVLMGGLAVYVFVWIGSRW